MESQNYEKNILEFNEQLNFKKISGFNLDKLKKRPKPDGLVVVGMGGSALAGDILSGLAPFIGLDVPVVVWKSYGLPIPRTYFKHPLFVFISFSGNTKETLSGLNWLMGEKAKTNIATISSGGELKKISLKLKLPFVSFDSNNLTPRQALGYTYYGLSKILQSCFSKVKASDLTKKIHPYSLRSVAKDLAKKIRSKIVLIYTDPYNIHLGYAWKTIINETAKLPAFLNFVPEMDHNEITSFEYKKFPFFAIFLNDPKDPSGKIKEKIKITAKILKSKNVPNQIINLSGQSKEEKTWNSIVLSHLTSFYAAKINKINPNKTVLIDKLKNLTK